MMGLLAKISSGLIEAGTQPENLVRSGVLDIAKINDAKSVKKASTKYVKLLENEGFRAREMGVMNNPLTSRQGPLSPRNIITPSDLQGSVLMPHKGDVTATDLSIDSIGGVDMEGAVSSGGFRFPDSARRQTDKEQIGTGLLPYWASTYGPAKAVQNKAEKLELNPATKENPVVGVYTSMGEEGNFFNDALADTMVQWSNGLPISKKDVARFDAELRKANESWVGLQSPDARNQLLGLEGFPKKGAGALRSKLVKQMSKAAYRDVGFPTKADILQTFTDADLVGAQLGDAGLTMGRIGSEYGLVPIDTHNSYGYGILGDRLGGFERSMPSSILMPDSWGLLGTEWTKPKNGGIPKLLTDTQKIDALAKRHDLFQIADQKWVDQASAWLEQNKNGTLQGALTAIGLPLAFQSEDADAGTLGLLSRMARAKEQGFDTSKTYYHGTPAEDIDAFDLLPERRRFPKSFGVHMANTKNEATHYKPPTSGSVQELYAAPQNTLEIDIPRGGHFVTASMKADLDRDDIIRQLVDAKRDGNPYDSVRIRKDMSPDWADWSGKEGYNENLIMLDPTRVRSVNAAFDPAKKDSSNLLAGAAGAGLLGAFQSEDADAGFFSQAVRAAENLSRKSGNAQGFFNDLTGKGQVKPDELNAMGFQEHFGKRSDISREEVQSFISDNQLQLQETVLGSDEAKFGAWTLDGGDNYRELVLQKDTSKGLREEIDALDSQRWDMRELFRDKLANDAALRQEYKDEMKAGYNDFDSFIASEDPEYAGLLSKRNALYEQKDSLPEPFINEDHFDVENSLLHLRLKDRVDTEGNKTLLVEEAQSDWHQTGAQEGYQTPNKRKELQDEYDRLDEEIEQAYELLRELPAGRDGTGLREVIYNLENRRHEIGLEDFDQRSLVPDAPFKTDDKSSWYTLAMKRALIEAAEGDYDKLAFTTGKQQADRYHQRKSIQEVRLGGNEQGGFTVSAFDKNDNPVIMQMIESLDKLPNLIGKDAANSLIDQPFTDTPTGAARILAGQDLDVGGEGMEQFYDRTLPNTLNKLVKQDGVKVGQSELDTTLDRMSMSPDDLSMDLLEARERAGALTIAGEEELRSLRAKRGDYKQRTDTVHSIDITPEMRERVKKGLPLFATAAAIPTVGGLLSPQAQAQGVLDMADAETNAAVRQQRLDRSKESPIMEMMSHAGLGLGQDILGNLAGIALPSLEQPVRDLVRPEDSRGPTAKAMSSQVANNFAPLIDNYIAPAMQNYVAPAAKAAYDYQPVFGGSAREQVNGLMDLYRQLPSSVREQVSPRIKNIGGLLESVL